MGMNATPADQNRVCRGPRWDECVPWGMQHQMRGHSGVTMHKSFVFGVTGGEWGIAEIAEIGKSNTYHGGTEARTQPTRVKPHSRGRLSTPADQKSGLPGAPAVPHEPFTTSKREGRNGIT